MRPEPVAVINAVIAAIEAGIALAAGFNLFGIDWDAQKLALVMALVVALGAVAKTLLVRNQVTPISDPKSAAGVPLVPAA